MRRALQMLPPRAFAPSTKPALYCVTKCDHSFDINIDFGPPPFYICSILAQRGRRPEAILKVERGRRSRGGARNVASGGAQTRWWGTTTPLRGARCTMPWRKCRGTESRWRIRKSPVERREARVPDRKGARGASQASRHVLATRARGPRKPPRLLGAPPPLIGRRARESKTRAHERAAGTKKRGYETWTWLFDIVNRGNTATRMQTHRGPNVVCVRGRV